MGTATNTTLVDMLTRMASELRQAADEMDGVEADMAIETAEDLEDQADVVRYVV